MKNVTLLFVGMMIFNIPFCYSTSQTEDFIDSLMFQWKNRDGAMFIIIGEKLSNIMVLKDTLFFKNMNNDIEEFNSWLEYLPSHTFTIYNTEDGLDSFLKEGMLLALKESMIEHSLKFISDDRYGSLAKRLHNKLMDIEIENLDPMPRPKKH